jgi:DNA-binding winged helix-turn-helix (wHTH) protein/tetratricopeptide (TPR) repeat protein
MNDRFSADDLPRKGGSAARASPWPIDLAHTRPFHLGPIEVRPASRELVFGERREVLEPLVMQVLVALANARGEILSREDLIDACWGGRAVSDDAINRVISRLRALGRDLGGFSVETVTKVGYRLVEDGKEPARLVAERPQPAKLTRRTIVAGAAAAVAAGAGFLVLRQPWRHRPPPEAAELFRRGEITIRQGLPGGLRQAISFYEQAVRIDPLYSGAWGALALAYTHLLEGYGEAEIRSVPDHLRSAARRALELDPDNADAHFALALIRPYFRNWASMEAQLRQLGKRYPKHWLGNGRLGGLMCDVGRIEDGIQLNKRLMEIDPMLPVGEFYLITAMLNADRLQEAEARLDRAEERWPGHPSIWAARYRMLMFNGRPQAAQAFVMNPDLRPSSMTAEDTGRLLRLAQAVDTQRPGDVTTSIDDFRKRAAEDIHNTPFSAIAFALLGRPDLTFASLERYYFNQGTFGPPVTIEPLTRRYARDLFTRPLDPLRSDPRFKSILQRVGLEDYWRETGTIPDYRRTA